MLGMQIIVDVFHRFRSSSWSIKLSNGGVTVIMPIQRERPTQMEINNHEEVLESGDGMSGPVVRESDASLIGSVKVLMKRFLDSFVDFSLLSTS